VVKFSIYTGDLPCHLKFFFQAKLSLNTTGWK
jgi:hypothetical protein